VGKRSIVSAYGVYSSSLSFAIVQHLFGQTPRNAAKGRKRDSDDIFQSFCSIHDPGGRAARATLSGNIADKFNAQLLGSWEWRGGTGRGCASSPVSGHVQDDCRSRFLGENV